MSKEKKLIIQSKKLVSLTELHIENSPEQLFTLKLDLGKSLVIKMLSDNILKIDFDHGEVILDITSKDLENIKFEEL